MQFAEEVEQVVGREEVFQLQLRGEEANLGAHLFGLVHHAAAVEQGVAAVGAYEGAQHAQGRGLAGAVGAQQAEYLAAVGAERQVVHRHLAARCGALYLLLLAREGEGLA